MKVSFDKEEYSLYWSEFQTLKFIVEATGYSGEVKAKIYSKIEDCVCELKLDNQKPYEGKERERRQFTYDLKEITFMDGQLSLQPGEHRLGIRIGDGEEHFFKFLVVYIPVQILMSRWCFGASLPATEIVSLRYQPRKITGVKIVDITSNTEKALYRLTWDAQERTLSWANGEPVHIDKDFTKYILPDEMLQIGVSGGDYCIAEIGNLDELPEHDVSEDLVADSAILPDEGIRTMISHAASYVINYVGFFPDATYLSTVKGEKGAVYIQPEAFLYRPRNETTTISINLGISQVRSVIELWGEYEGNKITSLSTNELSYNNFGMVHIQSPFPYFHNALIGNNMAGAWNTTIYTNHSNVDYQPTIQNFWNYKIIAGVIDQDIQQSCLEAIGLLSAIYVLANAGSTSLPGVSQDSFNKDGLSHNVNFQYDGHYAHMLKAYRERLGLVSEDKGQHRGMLYRLRVWGRGSQVYAL